MKYRVAAVVIVALVAGVLIAVDKPATLTHKLSEYQFGPSLSGDAVTSAHLAGKAVMIDAWGIDCPPCREMLPEIEKTSRRYKDKLVVIGAHVMEGTDAQILDVVKKNQLSYSIVKGYTGPISSDGLPHVHIFNAKGVMIFEGTPLDSDFEQSLLRAVGSVKK
jgi:thiol-disulfide isomerase/thioredoxin